MEYTMNMNDAVYDMSLLDQVNDDYSDLLSFLNSPNFRSFGEGLEAIIRKKMPQDCDMAAREYLEKCCQETGVSVASPSTRRNWFNGSPRPKKGDKSREDMFALAFALKLTVEETQELFHKVYRSSILSTNIRLKYLEKKSTARGFLAADCHFSYCPAYRICWATQCY